jgi:4-hydroxybenzoate polyprenyltransferase
MAAARTAALALNRYIGRRIDARNPRTANRAIQSGAIDAKAVLLWATFSLIVLGPTAWMLNPLAFLLFPLAVIFLVGYACTKRFTWLCHILDLTDGLAPAGAWVAVAGSLFASDDLPAWLLLGAVTF